ncbi:hypothetical protein LTR36_003654 [Oleoguttula mirabilis]|uniref:Uncharacterized protein n=1 Tax=Oleoguttula mirabilis TaxID=1507867 RepID=A0AAV9JJ16_9PEZI|nr:hypothetical protein LTR36_003654 [Oleoguttula mirabilis]
MTGLREQIKANLAALNMPQLETANIVLSKPVDSRDYTAWVLVGDGRPVIRGAQRDAPVGALEELLEAGAELVAERLSQRFTEFDEHASGMDGHGVLVLDELREALPDAAGGASTVRMGSSGRERSFTNDSGHGYKTTDGSCCGYGPQREVAYVAG